MNLVDLQVSSWGRKADTTLSRGAGGQGLGRNVPESKSRMEISVLSTKGPATIPTGGVPLLGTGPGPRPVTGSLGMCTA